MLLDELDVRQQAMAYVSDCSERAGGVVTRKELEAFTYEGQPLKLIDHSRGIRNPSSMSCSLTIMTSASGGYLDAVDNEDGLLHYSYQRGQAPDKGSNPKLRRSVELGLPLILLVKIEDGVFVPRMPVYLVDDDPVARVVKVAVDEGLRFTQPGNADQRSYVERLTRLRLHQPVFRARVLAAYEKQCAICRLKHVDLLDAAHIDGDAESGQPVVPNGLALCKIHHAAYDRGILGVRPDYVVQVRADVLEEVDGPMLRHGLQDVHGWRLSVPKRVADLPDREGLARRWETFVR